MPYLEFFFENTPEVRIMYYAGDIDVATVPFPGTQQCLETLKRPITEEWRPWVINGEVAGDVEAYDKYTFATLKGAGHEGAHDSGGGNDACDVFGRCAHSVC